MAINGSSSRGRCSNFIRSITRQTCLTPTSSVLFDGNVPTLTGQDGDMWASQLLTINTTANPAKITLDFTTTPDYTGVYTGVGIVEMVMFNCPEWGISIKTISLFSATSVSGSRTFLTTILPTTTSCDSLVRVCVSYRKSIPPVLVLVFNGFSTSKWAHLAEVNFYVIPPPMTSPPLTTQSNGNSKINSVVIVLGSVGYHES